MSKKAIGKTDKPPTAMRILLIHGRYDVDQEMDDWGFRGPHIEGIVALHATYLTTFAVWFLDKEAAEKARAMTGWKEWDENALEMRFNKDLLVAKDIDGQTAYYGDWELQMFEPKR